MHDAMEQGDTSPELEQDPVVGQERPADRTAATRARDQAARVRESLVRCPGIEGQRAA